MIRARQCHRKGQRPLSKIVLRLPRDWAIDGPFHPKLDPQTGAVLSFGTGWYRKRFSLPESAKGRQFLIESDGAMANSTVWLNGLGRSPGCCRALRKSRERFGVPGRTRCLCKTVLLTFNGDLRNNLFALCTVWAYHGRARSANSTCLARRYPITRLENAWGKAVQEWFTADATCDSSGR